MPDPLRHTLSATQTPAFWKVSPYTSEWLLYQQFANGYEMPDDPDNRMRWGKRMQSELLAEAAKDQKLEVIPNAADVYQRGQGQFHRLGCTRDATIIAPGRGPGALEIKMVFDYRIWMQTWGGGEAIPQHIEIQTQQQMAVGDDEHGSFDWGIIGVFVCGEMYYFKRDPVKELWDSLATRAEAFFEAVKEKREPPLEGSEVEMPLLANYFPTAEGTRRDFTAEMKPLEVLEWSEKIRMLKYHSGERLGHERAEKALKAEIIGLMKDTANGDFLHGISAKVKQQDRAGYTVKPTTFKVLTVHVPDNLPETLPGFIEHGDIAP